MAHYNLIHVNFLPSGGDTAQPSAKNPPIKKGEGEGGNSISPLTCHSEWREKFLEGGEYISIPLRRGGGGMLRIPRIEIVRCMEKLYSKRVMINPSESQQGIYEEAKKLVVSRYLKKEGLVKKGGVGGAKNPRPSWVNPKYR